MNLTVDTEVLRREGVRLLVLFGSRARGLPHPASDTDVGVEFSPGIPDGLEQREAVISCIKGAPSEIGLVVLNTADPLLLFEVATDGRPLFEDRPAAWEEFRIRASKLYYDTDWIRKIEAESLTARTRDGSPRSRPA